MGSQSESWGCQGESLGARGVKGIPWGLLETNRAKCLSVNLPVLELPAQLKNSTNLSVCQVHTLLLLFSAHTLITNLLALHIMEIHWGQFSCT